jgi:hypothetical protein
MELRRVAMTENEAIKELETSIDLAKMCTQNYERKNEIQGYEMAIQALEEVQKYRKIGTVEECREAVEKQTAISREIIDGKYFCPKCHNLMPYPGYCGCGQKVY